MTQQFQEDGTVLPITLVSVSPCQVTGIKEMKRDGYAAVQIGSEPKKTLSKPEAGVLKELPLYGTLHEFRMSDTSGIERGIIISASTFSIGDKVDVIGVSKGHGFQGVVKRHGFHGSPKSHGHKDQLRMPGSIASRRQGPVAKGKRMGGRMGGEQVTVQNLTVVSVDPEKNILSLKGAVPGGRGGLLIITGRNAKTIWQQ